MPKTNHHFVPQFYLRNFSNGRASISLINIAKALAVPTATISGQCYRPKFYGETNELEDAFSDLEGAVAPLIRAIIDGNPLPQLNTSQHLCVFSFLAFQ